MAQKLRPQAETLYGLPQPTQTGLYPPIIARRDPSSADTGFSIGQLWVNKTGNNIFALTSVAAGVANWEGMGVGSGNAPISKFIVSSDGTADFTTIQSAIDAASAAGGSATVYVRPGTYSENLTLVSTVDVVGAISTGTTINGVHTPPATGRVMFQNITLASATHIFSSADAGSATLFIQDCFLNVTNGYVFNVANWTGSLSIDDCGSTGTNDGVVNNTGGATVYFTDSDLGAGTGNTFTYSGGSLTLEAIDLSCPISVGTGSTVVIKSGCSLSKTLTTANNSSVSIRHSTISTGASAAISHGSSGTLNVSECIINSSNSPAITGAGAGVVTMTGVSFLSNSALAGTLTPAAVITRGGNYVSQYVVGTAPDAQYQTVQAAITAASAAGGNATVIVKPGTYTENLTLASTVDIRGEISTGVTITGVHTPPSSGRVAFQNLTLTSATHILSSAAAGSTSIYFEACFFNVTNGYIFNLLNWTGSLSIDDSGSTGTNDGVVNNTGGATVYFTDADLGAGTGNTLTYSGGSLIIEGVDLSCPISVGTGSTTTIKTGSNLSRTLTTANNSIVNIRNSTLSTGSSAAISHGSSGTISISESVINSTSVPALSGSGAGVITIGSATFLNSSTIASTLTVAGSNATSGGTLQTGALIQTFPNTYLTFKSSPLLTTAATTAGVATGATGATNLMHLQNGDIMEQFILGAGQTIIGPRMNTTGLLTSLDLTNAEGAEYNFGVNATNKHAYTIGTSPAFFIELSVNAADIGGLDPFMVGFRKQQANDATLANYTDFASIGARATTAADVIILQTQLNTGGVTITNTTDAWTDGQTKVFRVNVSSAGVVTYTINGVAPSVTAAFTFDSGDVVMPFIRHLFGAATPAAINWISLKIGYQ
jgi:pectin methylesterase-like acyl-CoA thioesterase